MLCWDWFNVWDLGQLTYNIIVCWRGTAAPCEKISQALNYSIVTYLQPPVPAYPQEVTPIDDFFLGHHQELLLESQCGANDFNG